MKTVFSTSDKGRILCHTERKRSISCYRDSSPSSATGVNRTQNDADLVSTHSAGQRKAAFTLAEVLITLGIIGVVAAMTLPAVIHKYQNKVCETRFKKSLAVISRAILMAKEQSGIDNFNKYCTTYISGGGGYVNESECLDYLVSALYGKNPHPMIYRKNSIKNFTSKYEIKNWNSVLASYGYTLFYVRPLQDGSYIGFSVNEYLFQIGLDTNGEDGPNRLGYDIFLLTLNSKDAVTYLGKPKNYTDEQIDELLGGTTAEDSYLPERTGAPCNLYSSQKGNGIGCSYYAIMDECPFDSSKKYFECLP